jgi:hypothetical protein
MYTYENNCYTRGKPTIYELYDQYCDMMPESRNMGDVARKRLGYPVPAEMNTQATIKELSFLCNGEVTTSITIKQLLGNRILTLGPPRGYITWIQGRLRVSSDGSGR